MTDSYRLFENQKYLNLETFRRNGLGVKTPVWFVQDGDRLFIRTIADSGKVKRIRNHRLVNIAPCKMDGELLADLIPALASEVVDPVIDRKVDGLLDKKYGFLKKMFSITAGKNGRNYTILEVKVRE